MSVTKIKDGSITRPGNTTTYADGDVVTGSTPAAMGFDYPPLNGDGLAILQHALLTSSANQSLKLEADLWLFSSAPEAVDADNAAWTPTDDDLAKLITVVEFRSANWRAGNAQSGANGNAVCQLTNLAVPVPRASTDKMLYGVLVSRNAYIPVSDEAFMVRLGIIGG